MSLVARYLESHGIPTLVLGSALDIVTHCGVPRFVFTDFPLGNPCGVPGDVAMQRRILDFALRAFESADEPGTVQQSPEVWPNGDRWRQAYSEVRPEDVERLRAAGEKRRAERAAIK